ncbi:MAG: NADH-quinone oxidoreductase subunit NuoF [Actinomycetota bacterium]|nr:NADH-quinone oxidoreductase subunit NuoF [Actinomycetota bacterium]
MKSGTATKQVKVGLSSCGVAVGGRGVYDALAAKLKGMDVELEPTGCLGMCYKEPLVEVSLSENQHFIYGDVTPERVDRIIDEHIVHGRPITDWLLTTKSSGFGKSDYFTGQTRIVLRNCGVINPESIDDYIAAGGYGAIEKALAGMSPEEVIEVIEESGLRGRGGAGFSTGLKWGFTRAVEGSQKYIICNANEGDPGAFVDRAILESDPHSIVEGMLIAGYAIGASQGIIYIRAEYPMAARRIELAISQAKERGFLGTSILRSRFAFDLKIRVGAGAYVCGEETSQMMSIEGKRGTPRSKPPLPAQSGLWGKPTSTNNVETLANIAWIITNGAHAYNRLGTETSKGTKVFALSGKVARGGLVEVPMGMTIRKVVFDVCGGTASTLPLKAVQIGGPHGGCIPASLIDSQLDCDSLHSIGLSMGKGGILVMDESTCMVDLAKYFLSYSQGESCGKCVPCRIGSKRMLEIFERITRGEGRDGDLELIEEVATSMAGASLCGLGQTIPNPTLSSLRYFRDEYEAHIKDKRCPAKKCKALISYEVLPDNCTGCGLCVGYCPTGAIGGWEIESEICTRCGLCMEVCENNAITVSHKEGGDG